MFDVIIITASRLRRKMLEMFFMSIERLKNESGLNIHVICSGDYDQADLAAKYDIEFYPMLNGILSMKYQYTLNKARIYNPHCITILDSDDIISTDTIIELHRTVLKPHVQVSGLNKTYYYSTLPETCGKLILHQQKKMHGACRTIRTDLLDKLDWILWDEKVNCGMHIIVNKRLNTVPHNAEIYNGILVDVKTRINMNKFSFWHEQRNLPEVSPEIFYNILSEKEKIQLQSVIKDQII